MNRTFINSLKTLLPLYTGLLLITISPMSFPFLKDTRIAGSLLLTINLFLKSIHLLRNGVLSKTLLNPGLNVFYIFIFFIFLSSAISPPIQSFDNLLIHLMSFIAFFTGYLFLENLPDKKLVLKRINVLLIAIGFIVSLISILIGFFKIPFLYHIRTLLAEKTFVKMVFEHNRGRVFPIAPLDIISVFALSELMYHKFTKNKKSYLFLEVIVLFNVAAIVLMNFRSRAIVFLFNIIVLFLLSRNVFFLKQTLAFFVLSIVLSSILFPNNIVNRFLLTAKDDLANIESRINYARLSLNIAKTSPIFGIGSGNLKNYVVSETITTTGLYSEVLTYPAYQHPHNHYLLILAESGILGLAAYILTIIYFFLCDAALLRNLTIRPYVTPLIIASWSYLFGSLMDWYSANMTIFFFLIRGILFGVLRR